MSCGESRLLQASAGRHTGRAHGIEQEVRVHGTAHAPAHDVSGKGIRCAITDPM